MEIRKSDHIEIAENEIEKSEQSGVLAEDACHEITVSQNTITDPGSSRIRCVGLQSGLIGNNTISGSGKYGIQIKESEDLKVEKNRLNSKGKYDLYIGEHCTGCVFNANELINKTLFAADTAVYSGSMEAE